MSRVAIIGTGDFGKQVLEVIKAEGKHTAVGFFDDFNQSNSAHSLPVLGTSEDIQALYEKKAFDALIVAIGYKHLKKKMEILEKYSTIPFASTIHPTSIIEPDAKIEGSVVIYANSYVGHRCQLKSGSVINVGVNIPHDNVLKSCSFLSVGVQMGGNTTIGNCSFIGVGAVISNGLNIADNTIIGAGSVVINNIENPGTYVGVPAKRLIK